MLIHLLIKCCVRQLICCSHKRIFGKKCTTTKTQNNDALSQLFSSGLRRAFETFLIICVAVVSSFILMSFSSAISCAFHINSPRRMVVTSIGFYFVAHFAWRQSCSDKKIGIKWCRFWIHTAFALCLYSCSLSLEHFCVTKSQAVFQIR